MTSCKLILKPKEINQHNLWSQQFRNPLGPRRDNQILDFTEGGAKKHYYIAIASLNETFDESHEKFVAFLSGGTEQVRLFGWIQIMSINVGRATKDLLVDYG